MGVQFGSFDAICQTAALVICPLLGSDQGIEPTCYSRNVDVGGTLIFQPCKSTFSESCAKTRLLCGIFGYLRVSGERVRLSMETQFCSRRHISSHVFSRWSALNPLESTKNASTLLSFHHLRSTGGWQLFSNMFRAYSRNHYDRYYDPSYSE